MECERVRSLLQIYEKGSGQKVNFDKSALFFSSNTTAAMRKNAEDIFKVGAVTGIEKYLGLPPMVGRNKLQAFREIKGKIVARLQGWCNRILSQGGREVMIKAVLQAIPAYAMNCFLLPKSLCDDINGLMRSYWWKYKKEGRGINWLKWGKLCRPKCEGGLGFRDMAKFNISMLAKQGWRLLRGGSSLCYRVLKAKYFPNSSFLYAKLGANPSLTWRSIWQSSGLLRDGLIWRIGNGEQVRIWKDNWLPRYNSLKPCSGIGKLHDDCKVVELIDRDTKHWNWGKLFEVFDKEEAALIASIPLSSVQFEDKLIWRLHRSGYYSVRSGYKYLIGAGDSVNANNGDDRLIFQSIWKAMVPNKIKIFAWRCYHDILPVRVNLARRQIPVDTICFRCGKHDEDMEHALQNCPAVKPVWDMLGFNNEQVEDNRVQNSPLLAGLQEDQKFALSLVVAWAIWKGRNDVFFNNKVVDPLATARFAQNYFQEFKDAHQGQPSNINFFGNSAWKAPREGLVKINFDGALDVQNMRGGAGLLARDHNGHVLGCAALPIPFASNAEYVEMQAAVKALLWASHMGFWDIILEGDALIVVNNLRSDAEDLSLLGGLKEEARLLLAGMRSSTVTHVKRSGNEAAHFLAKHALTLPSDLVWGRGIS